MALLLAIMSGDSATIRVARKTRDQLAEQARQRGLSVSALLAEIAREHELREVWRSERDAALADSRNAAASREAAEWDATLADGID